MLTSISTTSGTNVFTFSTASMPSWASPTIWMSSFVLRIAASPSRTTRWSSAMSTLIFSMAYRLLFGQRDVDDDCRATPFLRLDLAFTAHESSTLQDSANHNVTPLVVLTEHGLQVNS